VKAREAAQQGWKEGLRVIVRAAEPQGAVEAAAGQLGHRVVVRGEDPARVDEEALALDGERPVRRSSGCATRSSSRFICMLRAA
jgi:hypothetical protein